MADRSLDIMVRILTEQVGDEKANEILAKHAEATKAAAAESELLAASSRNLNEASSRHQSLLTEETAGTKKATEAAEGLELGKRELLESTRGLTKEMPILGEVMRAAYNPAGLSIFAIIGAFEIWIEKVKALTEAYGGIELPDFTGQIKNAQDIAVAYNGVGTAIRDAMEQFNSAPETYNRANAAINAQVVAVRNLIQANKDKAQADLDLERASGKIGPAAYAAKKSAIDQGYNAQTEQLEKDARLADLQAKKDEQSQLEKTAKEKTAAAASIKLPEDDAVVDAQIAAEKNQAAALRKQAEEHRSEADKLQIFKTGQDDHSWGTSLRQLPEALAFSVKYGALTDPGEIIKARNESAKDAEEKAIASDREAQRLEKAKTNRTTLRKQAEDAAGAATKLGLENAGQDDPAKVGSVAWQNAQAETVGRVKKNTELEKRFTGDVSGIHEDISRYTSLAGKPDPDSSRQAKLALADIITALQDATSVVRTLKDSGADITAMRRELSELKSQLANRH